MSSGNRRNKNIVQLSVVLILLAASVAALLFLRSGETAVEEEPETVAEEVYILGAADPPVVQSVEIRLPGEDPFTLRSENTGEGADSEGVYTIDGMDSGDLNQGMLRAVFNAAEGLPAKKNIGENVADLSAYGLDRPEAEVTVRYSAGDLRLAIGGAAPGDEGTYVQSGGTVYLVDSGNVSGLVQKPLHFVSRTVTPGNPESTRIQEATLSGRALPEPIVIEEAPPDEASALTGFSNYQITRPIRAQASYESGVSALKSVYGLTASEAVAAGRFGGEEAAAYGLDDPYLRVEILTVNGEGNENREPIPPFILLLSEPDGEGNVYVQCSEKDYVYRVPASSLPFLDLRLFDYQDKMILLPHIDTVSQVEVVTGEKTVFFDLDGEGDAFVVTADGAPLDAENFRSFYQTLISARYDAEIEEQTTSSDPEPSGEADGEGDGDSADSGGLLLLYTFRYRDGSPDSVVRFTSGPARKAVVSLDGGRAYYAQSTYVDRVVEDLGKVLAGESVKPYF